MNIPKSWLLAASVMAIACTEAPLDPKVGVNPPPDVRAYVTGAALENLDEAGRFQLPPPTINGPYPVISAEMASDLADGLIRTVFANPYAMSQSLRESVIQQHGAPIDWERIRQGPLAPYFAESHLEPLPLELGSAAIRHFGPRYLMPFYLEGRPVAVVGVSVHATDVTLDQNGYLQWPDSTGGEFRITGIPLELGGLAMPVPPEVAVEFAGGATGVKVDALPVLGVPGNDIVSTYALWRLRLAEAVNFTRLVDGEAVATNEVFVGVMPSIADARLGLHSYEIGLRILVAAASQPPAEVIRGVDVPIRSGYAVDLHEVRVAP